MQATLATIPTPTEIRSACAQIRKGWSDSEHIRRRIVGRIKLQQLAEQIARVPSRAAS